MTTPETPLRAFANYLNYCEGLTAAVDDAGFVAGTRVHKSALGPLMWRLNAVGGALRDPGAPSLWRVSPIVEASNAAFAAAARAWRGGQRLIVIRAGAATGTAGIIELLLSRRHALQDDAMSVVALLSELARLFPGHPLTVTAPQPADQAFLSALVMVMAQQAAQQQAAAQQAAAQQQQAAAQQAAAQQQAAHRELCRRHEARLQQRATAQQEATMQATARAQQEVRMQQGARVRRIERRQREAQHEERLPQRMACCTQE